MARSIEAAPDALNLSVSVERYTRISRPAWSIRAISEHSTTAKAPLGILWRVRALRIMELAPRYIMGKRYQLKYKRVCGEPPDWPQR